MKNPKSMRWMAITICLSLAWLCSLLLLQSQPLSASSEPGQTIPQPVVGTELVLYDAAQHNDTPDPQQLSYGALPPGGASQTFTNSVTLLDSLNPESNTAGYFRNGRMVLDREDGFTVRFRARVASETHSSEHRAGFSMVVLAEDKQGIELGFWQDEIWAQEGGSGPTLFTHAEGAPYDTTQGAADSLPEYALTVLGDLYSLHRVELGNTLILTGSVRDYTAFSGFPDPYETANLLFLGDNTTRAGAAVEIGYISVITGSVVADGQKVYLPLTLRD